MITPPRFSWARAATVAVLAILAARSLAFADTQAWLLLSADLRETVISTDPTEKTRLAEGGWLVNGTANLADDKKGGVLPLHRMSRVNKAKTGNDRYLEIDAKKLKEHVKDGFVDEGVMGYVSPTEQSGLVPVYRFTHGEEHLWLVDLKDQAAVEKKGWKLDGPVFWAWPAPKTAPKDVTADSPKTAK